MVSFEIIGYVIRVLSAFAIFEMFKKSGKLEKMMYLICNFN